MCLRSSFQQHYNQIYLVLLFSPRSPRTSLKSSPNVQPLLYYVTTIDFGQVTYEADIATIVRKADMEMLEYRALTDSVQSMFQTARMIIIRP